MESGERKIYELLRTADSMEHGESRLAIYEEAIGLADREHLTELQIRTRLDAIQESVFYLDAMKGIVMYPVMLKIADEYRADTGREPSDLHTILWQYKWILDNAVDFYQVTRSQFQHLAEDCMKRYQEHGYSLRTVYAIMFSFYQHIDLELAKKYYNEFLQQKRDSMSDCLACEKCMEMKFLLEYGWEKEALDRARSVFDGRLTCVEQPGGVYIGLINYIVRRKIRDKSVNEELEGKLKDYAEQVRTYIVRRHLLMDDIGNMSMYYCLYEPNKALGWIKKYCDYTEKWMEPAGIFEFSLGMMMFLGRIRDNKKSERPTYRMKMDSRFQFYNEAGVYDIQEMYDYYDGMAGGIAKKFEENQERRDFQEMYHAVKADLWGKFRE